jgi:hypothetical protein
MSTVTQEISARKTLHYHLLTSAMNRFGVVLLSGISETSVEAGSQRWEEWKLEALHGVSQNLWPPRIALPDWDGVGDILGPDSPGLLHPRKSLLNWFGAILTFRLSSVVVIFPITICTPLA